MIGKGGMSEVYLAMDKNLNKQWAVKEIKKRAKDRNNAVVVQSAIAEANMMKKLDHPCLPRIVDIIDREDVIYVIMDYIEGEPLNKVLEREGAQSQETVIEWAQDLCEVLDYLHMQNPPIIYRDMKPANIMLQPNGNIKLIDFGIAREYKEQNLEDTVSLGTKGYAAPEQFGGKGQTDARTDIYCLGVTLYHLVTGKNPCEPPYEVYPIRYWNPELSSGLEAIILKCTQLNPEDRYESCAELLYALRHYEEADDAYRNKQKKKLWVTVGMFSVAFVSLIIGIVCQLLKQNVNNNDYDNRMLQAEKTVTAEEKIEYYLQASEIKQEELDPYLGIVEAMKEDASFTIEEEVVLKQALNENLSALREQEGYSDLAYEIGKLYWYYYEYGKTDTYDFVHGTAELTSIVCSGLTTIGGVNAIDDAGNATIKAREWKPNKENIIDNVLDITGIKKKTSIEMDIVIRDNEITSTNIDVNTDTLDITNAEWSIYDKKPDNNELRTNFSLKNNSWNKTTTETKSSFQQDYAKIGDYDIYRTNYSKTTITTTDSVDFTEFIKETPDKKWVEMTNLEKVESIGNASKFTGDIIENAWNPEEVTKKILDEGIKDKLDNSKLGKVINFLGEFKDPISKYQKVFN